MSSRPFDPGLGDPSCDDLSRELHLYAEGELRSALALHEVRRHLARCEDCRRRLEDHDALTAAILAGDAPPASAGRLASRVLERIRRLPPRFSAEFVADTLGGAEPLVPRPRSRPWALRAAAALLAGGLAVASASLLLRGGGRREVVTDASRSEGRLHAAGAAEPGPRASGSRGELRWALTVDPAAGLTEPEEPFLRLQGFRAEPGRDDGAARRAEWVVGAAAGRRPQAQDKFFLVPEDSSGAGEEPVEFRPLGAFPARGQELPGPAAGGDRPRLYRVYVLRGPAALERPAAHPRGFDGGYLAPAIPPLGRGQPWTVLTSLRGVVQEPRSSGSEPRLYSPPSVPPRG
ncbi:MAG: hypothetical protein HY721_35120 [Planctomycetes bacterium]|nr:hypothetical protein [Planctomycetota bacterium]